MLAPLSRRLLQLSGKDVVATLRGIATANIEAFVGQEKAVLHTLLLNSKGKIVTDAMLVKPAILNNGKIELNGHMLWLDCGTEQGDTVVQHLKKYSFKKDLKIEDLSSTIDTLSLFVN